MAATPWPLVVVLLLASVLAGCPQAPQTATDHDPAQAPSPLFITAAVDEAAARETITWTTPAVELGDEDAGNALTAARQALADGRLHEGTDAAIPLYLALRQLPEQQQEANAGLIHATQALLTGADTYLELADEDADALHQVQVAAAVLRAIQPVLGEIKAEAVLIHGATFLQEAHITEQVWELNNKGERALQIGLLGEHGIGALAHFRAADALRPGQARARNGLIAVEAAMLERAEHAALSDDFAAAQTWLAHAGAVREDSPAVLEAGHHLQHLRRTRISRLRAQAAAGLGEYGGIQKAQSLLHHIQAIAAPGDVVAVDLRARIETASSYGPFGPGQMFQEALRDGGHGPQMVVIARGAFQMGALTDDPDAHGNEQPAHPVQFERGFAIAVHEVSVADFRRFMHSTDYQPRALRRGFSMAYDERSGNFVRRSRVDWQSDYLGHPADPDLPVVHVSARDAAAYADWLSVQTGAMYRLPSEAEFEYVLRAGAADIYPWPGEAPPPDAGNLTGSEDRSPNGRTWTNAFPGYRDGYWGPAPVGHFAANAFDVHDLAGNVSEWVADCWHPSYRRAPGDGSAWVNPGCRDQVIRGGSWASSPAQTRASWRAPASVDTTNARIGFRVVRVL